MSESTHTETRGWVYLIVNDLIENRVKIGFTTKDPVARAFQLVTTGTTGTLVVIYQALVANPYEVEQDVHKRLAEFNCEREWFAVCPNRAKEEIIAAAGAVFFEDTTPRWHRSQPEPSERTKTLLHEAKQAAEELRIRKEELDRAERLAAEQLRIKQAEEARQEQEKKAQELYRAKAEEEARAAAEAERERLAELRREQIKQERIRRNKKRVFSRICG